MALSKEELNLINKSGVIPDHLLAEYLSDKLLVKPDVAIMSDEEAYQTAKARLSNFSKGSSKVDNSKKKGK